MRTGQQVVVPTADLSEFLARAAREDS